MTTPTPAPPAELGSWIGHPDLPGRVLEVLDVRPCCMGADGVPDHVAYIVSDLPWGTTWVCSLQAVTVSA